MDFISCWFRRCLVAFLGLILFSPVSFAQTVYPSFSEAMAVCNAFGQNFVNTYYYGIHNKSFTCVNFPETNKILGQVYYRYTGTSNPNNSGSDTFCKMVGNPPSGVNCRSTDDIYSTFPYLVDDIVPEPDCSGKQEFDSVSMRAPTNNGTGAVCYDGCSYSVSVWYQGTYPTGNLVFTFSPSGLSCVPSESEPDPIPYNPENPNLPDDPLDLPPGDGGVNPGPDPGAGADENGKGSASGGVTCSAPPSCTGDSLQCNILYQTWSSRCATELGFQGLVEGGIGDVDNIVDAVDVVGNKIDVVGNKIDVVGNKIDGLGNKFDSAFGNSPVDTSGPIDGLSVGNVNIDASSLDDSGLSMPRTCPSVLTDSVNFSFFGNSYSLSFLPFCELLDLVGQLLVVLASFVGIRILLRSVQ